MLVVAVAVLMVVAVVPVAVLAVASSLLRRGRESDVRGDSDGVERKGGSGERKMTYPEEDKSTFVVRKTVIFSLKSEGTFFYLSAPVSWAS